MAKVGKSSIQRLNPPPLPVVSPIAFPIDQEEERQNRWQEWRLRPDVLGTGSYLEFLCWEYLTYQKKQVRGVDYIYQYPLLGGRTAFGGFVADFYFPYKDMVWNPAGLRFHYTSTTNRAKDRLAKALLGSRGISVIYLWEDDLIQRTQYTLNQAWNGVQIGAREI